MEDENRFFIFEAEEGFNDLKDELEKLHEMETDFTSLGKGSAVSDQFRSLWDSLNQHIDGIERALLDTELIFKTAIEHHSALENQFGLPQEQSSPLWKHHEFINRFSREWICLVNQDYHYVAMNNLFLKAHKSSRHQLLGAPIQDYWDETIFNKKLKPSIDSAFKGQENKKQLRCTLPGTGEIYLEIGFFPYRSTDSEDITHVILYARDISGKKFTEQLIHQQNIFLDKIKDAILIQNNDGYITFWNKGCERLFGWTEEDAIGKTFKQLLFRKVDRAQYDITHEQYQSQSEWEGELQLMSRRKRTLFVESRWYPYKNTKSGETGTLIINSDISSIKDLEKQFFRSQRVQSIGDLTSGIAHDLNNVLSSFFLAIRALKPKLKNQQEQFVLNMLENSANRGVNLVRQILAFTKGIDEHEEVDIQNLCDDLKSFVHDTFPKSIIFSSNIDTDLWRIFGNPTQIHQVLLNVCVNAKDAIEGNGSLDLSINNRQITSEDPVKSFDETIPSGNYIQFSIKDSGKGIPKKEIEKIFTPFYTTKAKGKGTGLGLSTVKTIIYNHNGYLLVDSEKGKGTTFTFLLPALASE